MDGTFWKKEILKSKELIKYQDFELNELEFLRNKSDDKEQGSDNVS